jgi:hypothetical protein
VPEQMHRRRVRARGILLIRVLPRAQCAQPNGKGQLLDNASQWLATGPSSGIRRLSPADFYFVLRNANIKLC